MKIAKIFDHKRSIWGVDEQGRRLSQIQPEVVDSPKEDEDEEARKKEGRGK